MTDERTNGKSQRELLVELTVSAAVQENKLDTVIETLDKHCQSEEKWRGLIEGRMRVVENEQVRQEEGLKNTIRNATGLNALYATVVAALAGIFGNKV